MTLNERAPQYHDTPRSAAHADDAGYARARAQMQADARARAEREARLDKVDVSKIYWG